MLADILKMIYALPTKEQMEKMTTEELIKKFDEPDSDSSEE